MLQRTCPVNPSDSRDFSPDSREPHRTSSVVTPDLSSLRPDSRGLHRTCLVPDQLPESFHWIPERSTGLVWWPHRTCLTKDSPMALFEVEAINRLPSAHETVAHSQETKYTPKIQFLSSLPLFLSFTLESCS
jgi:hypothetical protein